METVDLSLLSEEDGIVKFQNILQNHAYNKHKIELCVAFERVPSEMYFQRIIDLLFIYKSCYLKMIKYIKEKSVQMEKIAIHAGEEVCISSRKIILGDVNVGGHLLVNANVVVIGSVKGKVTLLSDDASIFASKFENAKIYTPFGIMKEITGINQLISQEDLGNKNMARIIVFTSGKGGVGKTTVVSCLGRCLALKNYKVVLIDADLGLKNLDVVMGLESRIVFDLEDVIKGRASLKQALVQDKMSPNLFLLPACIRIDVKTVDETYMTSIINQLQSDFDFILIDSPAGIEQGFNNAIKNAQEAIVVMTLDKASLRDADKVVGILKNRNFEKIHLLINKYNPKSNRFLSIEEATRVLAIPVAGVIEDEKEIVKVQNFGLFLNNGGSAFRAFDELAISISGRKLEKKNTLSFLKFIKKNTKS